MQFICDYTMWPCLSVFEISTVHLKRAHIAIFQPPSLVAAAMEILLSFACCGADKRRLAESIFFPTPALEGLRLIFKMRDK